MCLGCCTDIVFDGVHHGRFLFSFLWRGVGILVHGGGLVDGDGAGGGIVCGVTGSLLHAGSE